MPIFVYGSLWPFPTVYWTFIGQTLVCAVPRTIPDARLATRESRSKLKVAGKPYYRLIDPGLHLGYRKGKAGGRWVVRWYVGNERYKVETLDAVVDDHEEANGSTVLSFSQAQVQARRIVGDQSTPKGPLTVREACERYVEFLRAERKTADDTEGRLEKHICPTLADKLVASLTRRDIEACRNAMVRRDEEDADVERASKDSANRVLSMLKAALNRAFEDDENEIPSDVAWRKVKPFKGVSRARQVHLDQAQSRRFINACQGALRRLVTVALLTGARAPGELAACRVRDFHAELGTLSVDGKTGPRDIVLTREAIRYLAGITRDLSPGDLLLTKDDGTAWGQNHQLRPVREAVALAKLPDGCTLYSCRHTYASQSILAGMNLKLLAENMGTSIRMLELHYAKFIATSRRKLIDESAFKLGLESNRKVVIFPPRAN